MTSCDDSDGVDVGRGHLPDREADRINEDVERGLDGRVGIPAANRHPEGEERDNLWESGHRERET